MAMVGACIFLIGEDPNFIIGLVDVGCFVIGGATALLSATGVGTCCFCAGCESVGEVNSNLILGDEGDCD